MSSIVYRKQVEFKNLKVWKSAKIRLIGSIFNENFSLTRSAVKLLRQHNEKAYREAIAVRGHFVLYSISINEFTLM